MISGLYCQKTMKTLGNFIYILRYWPKYSMLTTVTQDNGYAGLFKLSTRQSFSLSCPVASSSDSAFLRSLQIQASP